MKTNMGVWSLICESPCIFFFHFAYRASKRNDDNKRNAIPKTTWPFANRFEVQQIAITLFKSYVILFIVQINNICLV